MLKIQQALNQFGFDEVVRKYDLKTVTHPDGRIILNYDQIKSPKFSPITQECRGLVLEAGTWNLVARAFPRFFNLGEDRASDNKFEWTDCNITEKCDGSLLLVYFYQGKWHVNTRGSFGAGQINDSPYTWRALFDIAAPGVYYYLDESLTYVFELCSPYNRVVRHYSKPCVYLLSIFEGKVERRDLLAIHSAAFSLPKVYHATSADEAAQVVSDIAQQDCTHEGVVACDINGHRLKIKSAEYVRLHRIASNGNIASDKNLLDIVMNGEIDEVVTYWPEFGEKIRSLQNEYNSLRSTMDAYYNSVKDIEVQKDFALAVQTVPWRSLLFSARKHDTTPSQLLAELDPERVLEWL